jgi:DNA-binding Lrp family transcriptional regulator
MVRQARIEAKMEKGKLGKIERRILYELDRDASQTLGEIGKKIRKSPQYVQYWITKFTSEGYIKGFTAVIDYKRLGYSYYTTYFSFRAMPPEKEEKFYDFLKNERSVTILYRSYGAWDVIVGMLAKDPLEVYETLSKIKEKFGDYVGNLAIETHVGSNYYGRNYLSEEMELKEVPVTGGKVARSEIDEKDMRILSVLRENARASTIELAEEAKLTPDIVRYRLKKLKENKILLRSTMLPNYGIYPFMFYRLMLKLRNLTLEKEKSIVSFFAGKPNIFRLNKEFGSYDMSVDFEGEDKAQLRDIINEMKAKFYDLIIDFDSLQIWKVERSSYFVSV